MSKILNRGIECSITYQVEEERPLKWWKDIIDRLVSVGANTPVVCPGGAVSLRAERDNELT